MARTEPPPVVRVFARRAQAFFGERLVGVYLGGSFVTGGWRPGSDYDVAVVVTAEPSVDEVERLRALHQTLAREDAESLLLEGDYLVHDTIVPEGTTVPAWWFRKGTIRGPDVMMSADNIANLGRDGIAVLGPAPAAVFPSVTPAQIRAAVREMMAEPPDSASEQTAAREILDLARSLRALESGEPTSRAEGFEWGMRTLDARWRAALLHARDVSGGAAVTTDDDSLRRTLVELRSSLGLQP